MKHTLFFVASALALGLASCAQDDPELTQAANGEAISFRPGITRASETTNANLSSFFVTAEQDGDTNYYFKNLEFAKGADNFFTSSPSYLWPGDGIGLTFYAYAPSQDALGADVVFDGETRQLQNFVTPEEIADQVDFITAKATGNKTNNEASGVELTFNHQLSQIEIQAKSGSKIYTFKVKGVRIGRPETTGTFDFNTSTWTMDDWHETAVYTSSCDEVTLTNTPVSIMGASGNAMLIPQTLTPWSPTNDPDNVAREAYLSVLVNITTTETGDQVYPFLDEANRRHDTEYGWVAIPLGTTWKAGMKYVYTLDFTNGAGYEDPDDPNPGKPVLSMPIKFSVNVMPWVESDVPTDMAIKTPTKAMRR